MSGVLEGGVCTHCGKTAGDGEVRPMQTLPAGYLLCNRQYYLGRVLGSGGFGITYLAWDRKNNRKAAVKEFFPQHLAVRDEKSPQVVVGKEQDAEFQHSKMRFLQEAQALYELDDVPEVIDVFHLFEENGTAYYVMELLEGQDLKKYLAVNGVMSWVQLQSSLIMILRALDAVHRKKMIHRDISPDNIFMLQGGGAKLIDFGNARSYMSSNPLTKIIKTRFAPVEQFSDEGRQGPWTDIYSLCVTMYYALSGTLPPPSSERLICMKEQGKDPVKPLETLNPKLPLHVVRAIRKGMAVMEQKRFHTVRELSEQLFPDKNILERQALPKLRQIPEAKQPTESFHGSNYSRQTAFPTIQCIQGVLQGKQLSLRPGRVETVGRGRDVSVVYPAECPGISRHQCSFTLDNKGSAYVRDDGSSYGTRLNDRHLKPMEWNLVKKGDIICFAKEKYRIL